MRRSPSRYRRRARNQLRFSRIEPLEERINLAVASYDLGALSGTDGFVLNGIDAHDFSGRSVSSAGDVNGDGFDDLLIGARDASQGFFGQWLRAGETYVVFGQAGGFAASLDLSTLNGTNGFVLNGIDENDRSGDSVSSAGDVNGDGFDDLVIGAYFANAGGIGGGETYVVFGQAGGFAASLDLSTLDGTNGFVLNGIDGGDYSGRSVSTAGDVNGDGFDDLVIGADGADPGGNSAAGESYVVFGQAGGLAASIDLSTLNGSNGFVLNGIDENDRSGRSVSSAGDVNGDGFGDLIIGAEGADPGGNGRAGESYVVFGQAGGFAGSLDLSTLDGTNGFVLNGVDTDEFSGSSVSSAGDVNGDGFDDLVIGADYAEPGGDSGAGESYVVFGAASGFAPSFDLSTLNGTNGFVLEGDEFDFSGRSVSTAGDVNGDGFDDLLIGAPFGDGNVNYSGATYVVFGAASGFGASFQLSTLNGASGFVLNGIDEGDRSGNSVSGAGDVNGDGFDDLVIGAYRVDAGGTNNAGATYVFFGRDFTSAVTHAGDDTANGLTGTAGADVIVAGQGDDTLEGAGGGDVLRGGEGDDRIQIGDATFARVAGGNGTDTLEVGTFDLDLTAIADNQLTGIEAIDLATAAGGQTLKLTQLELLNLSDSLNTLVVHGTTGDAIDAGVGWIFTGTESVGPDTFNVYTQGAAALKVENDVALIRFGIDLSTLDGSDGFVLEGIDAEDFSGGSVSSAGDFNGDGFDDVIIGARKADPGGKSGAGESYVVFGQAGGFSASLDLSTLDGTNGFVIEGIDPDDRSGDSVRSAGDVNGDGFDDLVIGAYGADPGGNSAAGESYVVFGAAGGFAASFDLSTLNGTNGFVLEGIDAYDLSGRSVSGAGDINGDGFDDLVIGAHAADPGGINGAGETYVVFGGAGFAASLQLSTLNGANGFVLHGIDVSDNSGSSVSGAGDVNGDGYDDLIIGAFLANPDGNNDAGESYVVLGQAGGFAASFDLSDLNGTNGFALEGIDPVDISGRSVSGAGDVNGDGFDDFVIGAYAADPGGNNAAGESYVVFGAAGGFAARVDLSTLNGTNGFVVSGIDADDHLGVSVSAAGDFNGDGFDDLMIGAYRADPGGQVRAGETYVIFGRASAFPASLDLSILNHTEGFLLHGINPFDFSGGSVSSAGDVNGDGFDDLILGAQQADPGGNSSAGESYVFFGRDFTGAVTMAGDDTANLLLGTAAVDVFIAGQDDDILQGSGGADVLRGGEGDDRFRVGDAGFVRVDGGRGTDRLDLLNFDFDLTTIADNRLTGIEVIDLGTTFTSQTLTLNQLELLNLSDTSNTLVVYGTVTDSIAPGYGWSLVGTEVIGTETYTVLTQGAATLKFDSDINTVGPVLLGDINGDGMVDGLDANVVSANFLAFPGGGATFDDGDLNGDGKVDGLDANVVSANFSNELPAETDEEAAVHVVDEAVAQLVAENFLRFSDGAAMPADGDVTGDGRVDGLDLNWLAVRLAAASDVMEETVFEALFP